MLYDLFVNSALVSEITEDTWHIKTAHGNLPPLATKGETPDLREHEKHKHEAAV